MSARETESEQDEQINDIRINDRRRRIRRSLNIAHEEEGYEEGTRQGQHQQPLARPDDYAGVSAECPSDEIAHVEDDKVERAKQQWVDIGIGRKDSGGDGRKHRLNGGHQHQNKM